MSWATRYIEELKSGKTVQFRPHGGSMAGLIESGQLVTVEPLGERLPQKGDIVLCKVKGAQYLHLVKACGAGDRYLIGNNRGGINGWTSINQIYGHCIAVEK